MLLSMERVKILFSCYSKHEQEEWKILRNIILGTQSEGYLLYARSLQKRKIEKNFLFKLYNTTVTFNTNVTREHILGTTVPLCRTSCVPVIDGHQRFQLCSSEQCNHKQQSKLIDFSR